MTTFELNNSDLYISMLVHLYIIKGHGHDHWSELIFIYIFIERQRKKTKLQIKKTKLKVTGRKQELSCWDGLSSWLKSNLELDAANKQQPATLLRSARILLK